MTGGEVDDWLAAGDLSHAVCQELCLQAARYDAAHVLHMLLTRTAIDQDVRQRALWAAVRRRCYTAMHLLLQHGADQNHVDRTGTLLHHALWAELEYGLLLEDLTGRVLRHVTQGLEVLLQYHPDPTIVVNGRTPRELAVEMRQFAAADRLAQYEERYRTR